MIRELQVLTIAAIFIATGLVSNSDAEAGVATADPVARPAVIAHVEGGLWAMTHPEFARSFLQQELQREAAGIPNATISIEPSRGPLELPLNTHVRINGTSVIGWFDGRKLSSGYETFGERSHTTTTMARIIGSTVGGCPECLVIAVSPNEPSFAWLLQQDWVDAVSISLGGAGTAVFDFPRLIQNLTTDGKPVFVSAGNDPAVPPLTDGLFASPSIQVGYLDEQGRANPLVNPGPDIMTTGTFMMPPHDPDGRPTMHTFTSHAAPYAAGNYGRFLMEAWADGDLERTVEDGRVRNRVLATGLDGHDLLGDGWLDGPEVRALLGSFADPDPEALVLPTKINLPGHSVGDITTHYPEPSYWAGYGALYDSNWSALFDAWDNGFPPIRTPGPAHQIILEYREEMAWRSIQLNDLICTVWEMQTGPIHIGDRDQPCGNEYYMHNDDWYQ